MACGPALPCGTCPRGVLEAPQTTQENPASPTLCAKVGHPGKQAAGRPEGPRFPSEGELRFQGERPTAPGEIVIPGARRSRDRVGMSGSRGLSPGRRPPVAAPARVETPGSGVTWGTDTLLAGQDTYNKIGPEEEETCQRQGGALRLAEPASQSHWEALDNLGRRKEGRGWGGGGTVPPTETKSLARYKEPLLPSLGQPATSRSALAFTNKLLAVRAKQARSRD